MRLLLIRHGETEYNLNKRYCGFSNPPLNEAGIYQIRCLHEKFSGFKIDSVYSSDLLRAVETASIIFKDNRIEKTDKFREMNFGVFEGLTYSEIIKQYPDIYRAWVDNPSHITIPGGGKFAEFIKRIQDGLSFIIKKHRSQQIALITHSGPIRVILCKALKYEFDKFWKIEQANSALNIIDYFEDSSPIVSEMNNISHLTHKEETL